MTKGLVLLAVALLLDLFQGLIMLSFMGIVTATSGLLALVPVAGAIASGAVSVTGMVLGYVIDVSLSFGFGSFLLMLLKLNDSLSIKSLLWGTPIELLLPFLPGWTLITASSLYTTYKADKALAQTDEVLA